MASPAGPSAPSTVASQVVQLFRGPTQPSGLPANIVSGLSSTDPTTQRVAIAQMRAFVRELFFLDFSDSFQISNLVSAGIIGVLIIIGIPVVLHRLYHGRLQVFRLERRMQGSYIVPNAINCFLLLEGVYGFLVIVFNIMFWKLYKDHVESWLYTFQAFRSLIWIPLYIGAFLTGWGSFYTAPGALDKPSAARNKTSAKGHLSWPLIVNLSCLGTPLALIISLLPPVTLSSIKMTRTFHSYKDWDQQLQRLVDSTVAGALIDPTVVQRYRSQGYNIFSNWTKSYYYVDIAYVLWGFWALLFLAFYVCAGGALVYMLWRQVQKQKTILISYQRKIEMQLAQEDKQTQLSILTADQPQAGRAGAAAVSRDVWLKAGANSRLGAPLDDIYEDRAGFEGSDGTGHSGATGSFKGSHEVVGLDTALRQDVPSSHQVHGALTPGLASRTGQVMSLADEGEYASSAAGQSNGTPPFSPKSPSAFRRLMRMETASSSNRGAQSPQQKTPKPKRISITGGPMSRYKYLRRCLVNLMILYFGIISAACFFGAVTIYLAAVEYEHALEGPTDLARSIAIASSTASWASAIFGALTIGSIIFRNFDNPLPEASQPSGEGAGNNAGGFRRRFHRNGSKTGDSGSGGADAANAVAHDKSRTLPAVPESVDLEASMMSFTRSRPNMAPNTPMRFALRESESFGGFVIRPDDQLASVMSNGNTPEMEEASRSGYYDSTRSKTKTHGSTLRPPPAARAWLSREREATMSIPQDVTESFGLMSMPMVAMNSELGRSRQGSADRESAEDAAGHYKTTDSTLAEYPSFDPQILERARQASSASAAAPRAQEGKPSGSTPSSPVLKRQSRLSESVGNETAASKIAREWAQSQYLATPLPETPTMGGTRSLTQTLDGATFNSEHTRVAGEDAWTGSPPSSPPRPSRNLERLAKEGDSPGRDLLRSAVSPGGRF